MSKADLITKLQRAIQRGQTSAVDALEDIEIRDELKRTPLHYAAKSAKPKIVSRLVQSGADIEARDYRENTPLHHAAQVADAPSVEALMQAGAAIEVENTHCNRPLHLAALGKDKQKTRTEIARGLIANGASLDVMNSNGWTPLIVAAMSGNLALVDLLLEAGADPTASLVGEEGTALAAARETGHTAIVRRLEQAKGAG